MGRRWQPMLSALQLTRVALVFTAISNIWLVLLIGRAEGAWSPPVAGSLALSLLCTAGVAVGMYAFGMSLNDIMDARRDRTFAPERPIPSGQIRLPAAVALSVAMLLLSLLSSLPLGWTSTALALATAVLILFYDALGKHIPAVGVLCLGIIRGMHMLIANPVLGFFWPVWLTVSHVLGTSAAAYRLEGKRPRLTGAQAWAVTAGWVFLSMVAVAWRLYGEGRARGSQPWSWAGPLAAAVLFLVLSVRSVRKAPDRRAAGAALMKVGLLWLIVYDASWLLSARLWGEGLLVAALLPAATLSMWGMRQLAAAERPLGYRLDRRRPGEGQRA